MTVGIYLLAQILTLKIDDYYNPNPGDCLICREGMDSAKKLPCGHVFHLDCLRMWLQHQQSCPLCRSVSASDTPVETSTYVTIVNLEIEYKCTVKVYVDCLNIFQCQCVLLLLASLCFHKSWFEVPMQETKFHY